MSMVKQRIALPKIDLSPFNQPQDENTEAYWDFRAPSYDLELTNTQDAVKSREKLVELLMNKGAIGQESVVLDLGCGPGLFTVEFAKRCNRVVGVDISGKMLERANLHARSLDNVEFCKMDWVQEEMQPRCKHRFDLVFANMSPAIRSVDTLNKMMSASRRWCFYSTFAQRTSNIRQKLDRLCEIHRHYDRIYYVFHILWSQGIQPEIWYETQCVQRKFSPEQALAFYQKDYFGQIDLCKMKEVIWESIAADGMVVEEIHIKKGCMLWQINKIGQENM